MKIIDWKPIKGFEDLYEISNTGEVRSLDHIRRTGRSEYLQKGKLLKSGLNKKTNYLMVSLSKNGKSITKYIHKLVAETFLDNPNNYKEINHIDGNKLNNKVENLEWCSRSYNIKQAFVIGLKDNSYLNKRVGQYDMNDNLIKEWNSQKEIGIELGYNPSVISNCCNNHIKSAYGFKWKLLDLGGDK